MYHLPLEFIKNTTTFFYKMMIKNDEVAGVALQGTWFYHGCPIWRWRCNKPNNFA